MTESTQLPILDELEEMNTYTGMAAWLVGVPFAVIVTHGHLIAEVLEARGFREGLDYLSCLRRSLQARNSPYGLRNFSLPNFEVMKLDAERLDKACRDLSGRNTAWHEHPVMVAEGASASARPSACEAPAGASPQGDSARPESA